MNEQTFSIRLSNGRAKTFTSAAEMAYWVRDQKALESVVRRANQNRRSRRRPRRPAKLKPRHHAGPPLARFNKNATVSCRPAGR